MKRSAPSSVDAIRSAIRAAGARVTTARVRVMAALQAAHGPVSHGDVEDLLAADALPPIDRVTLYRVLDWLYEVGFAHKAVDARGVFRFSPAQPNVEHAAHVHFRCTGCGGVFCLKVPPPPPPALPRGFRLTGMDLDLHGECQACAHKHP